MPHPLPHRRRNLRAARSPILAASLLGLALLLVPGALARGSHPQRSACSGPSAHRSHGTLAGRCVKHSTRKVKTHSHSPAKHRQAAKKPTHELPSAKTVATTAATCEDGSTPVRERSGAPFECQDGSEPGCEDGSAPTLSSASAVPLCPAGADSGSGEALEACEQESEEGECSGCEAGAEACQPSGSGEESEG